MFNLFHLFKACGEGRAILVSFPSICSSLPACSKFSTFKFRVCENGRFGRLFWEIIRKTFDMRMSLGRYTKILLKPANVQSPCFSSAAQVASLVLLSFCLHCARINKLRFLRLLRGA